MRDFGRGLLFFAGGRKGTRRSGAQRKGFAGLLPGAQGLTPGKHKILGTGSIRGETLKSFLRSGRLKSCFGEHDFSSFLAPPGLKILRSAPDCSRNPSPCAPLPRVPSPPQHKKPPRTSQRAAVHFTLIQFLIHSYFRFLKKSGILIDSLFAPGRNVVPLPWPAPCCPYLELP